MRHATSFVRRAVLAALLLASVLPGVARAQQPVLAGPRRALPAIPNAQVVPPTAVLGIISGGLSGTYIRIAADIGAVFRSNVPQMRILPIVGFGSLQNLSDIMNIRDVDIGIVQSDVLSFLHRNAQNGLEYNITYLAKLYDEEVHILARADITSPSDLTGKKVSVDGKGSGTALTASVIFDSLGIKPETVNDDPETALARLKRGEIAALVYVTGKPARLFNDAGDTGLHLLSLPLSQALLQTYLPSRFDHSDYPGLVPEGTTVETVAVGAVMAVYNWQPGTERFTRLSRFVDAFFDNLAALQAPGHHPKWKQVSLTAQVPGWQRFRAAQAWLQRHGAPAASEPTR